MAFRLISGFLVDGLKKQHRLRGCSWPRKNKVDVCCSVGFIHCVFAVMFGLDLDL